MYNERRKWRQDQPELSEAQVTVNIVSDNLQKYFVIARIKHNGIKY